MQKIRVIQTKERVVLDGLFRKKDVKLGIGAIYVDYEELNECSVLQVRFNLLPTDLRFMSYKILKAIC